jgi:uncharacterized membrane protein
VTDERMDQWIGALLRGGVILAAAVVFAGGIWHLIQSGAALPEYRIFHGELAEGRSLRGVIGGIAEGHSADLIQLGLLLLIATPVARVLLCAYLFAAQRDRTYVAITVLVLAILTASMAGLRL